MGDYLSTANKTKDSSDGENTRLRFGASAMQGWRKSMEDAHITALNVTEDVSLFAVFDGHGGPEVAQYSGKHFVDMLKKHELFKKGDYKNCLIDIFMKIDQDMQTAAGKKELRAIQRSMQNPDAAALFSNDSEDNNPAYYAGCTANVVLITKNEIYTANAGDSRCVLARNGTAKNLSTDHKPD